MIELLIRVVLRGLTRLVLGKSISATGNLASSQKVRLVLVVLCIPLAAGVAVASALFWGSARVPQANGLLQYVQQGGDAWVLIAPISALLLTILLLIPASGRFGIALLLAGTLFFGGLAALANLQGDGTSAVNTASVVSLGISALLMLVVLGLALSDNPPLDSPLAPVTFVYLSGRLKHLRGVNRFGEQRGWSVTGPTGGQSTLTIRGAYDPAHEVTLTSALHITVSSRASAAYVYSCKMTSPADIVACRVSYTAAPKKYRATPYYGECRQRGKRTIYYFLDPRPEEARLITPQFMERLGQVVESGRPFFTTPLDFLHATPFGIRFTHQAYYRMTSVYTEPEPLLRWMRELVGLLEPVSLRADQVQARVQANVPTAAPDAGPSYWN